MIAFWFLPYAIASGNTVIIKPSEQHAADHEQVVPTDGAGRVPGGRGQPGQWRRGHGQRASSITRLIQRDHLCGSTDVARTCTAARRQTANASQAQGGAKNPVVILPDADMEMTTKIVIDSAFGNAGQRCLAASTSSWSARRARPFSRCLAEAASSRVVGYGLDAGVQMGPVITPQSKIASRA